MNRVKIILTDSPRSECDLRRRRGAIEAFVGIVAFGGLLGLVLYGVIFVGQVL